MRTTDEVLHVISQVLLRALLIGFAVMAYWWAIIQFSRNYAYQLHLQFVPSLSMEHFELIHYVGLITLKLVLLAFFGFPWLAIALVLRKRRKQREAGKRAASA